MKDVEKLTQKLKEISHLTSTISLLSWDQQVYMPVKGAELRAGAIGMLSELAHQRFIELDNDGLLSSLNKKLTAKKLSPKEAVIVAETYRSYEREKKLPASFVREMAETTSQAETVWEEAKRKNDYQLFKPWLKKVVELNQREAKYLGYKKSPYDALLSIYEPGMTTDEATMILEELKNFLMPFLKRIQAAKVKIKDGQIKGNFPIQQQEKFSHQIMEKMGFDLGAGRLDQSVHPFTTNFSPLDVRITTRYNQKNIDSALFSTIHETGHALYEQGMETEHFGTPLGESISLGIHESQSRMWENMVGRALPFWKYFYPKLQKEFPLPFKKTSLPDFYRAINKVKPSLIRTEADEITYNLHIIIRFEIEKELIEGQIDFDSLPEVWNAKYKEYLGIDVPSDSLGILQDVHWSGGGIGYFPTYSFGNLYAAQFYHQAKHDIPNLEKKITQGNLKPLREWLRQNIHIHGKFYSAGGLVREVTGEELNSKYFTDYLTKKYSEIYELD